MDEMKKKRDEGQFKKEMILYSQIVTFFVIIDIFILGWSYYDWVRVPLENTQMSPSFREYSKHIGSRVDAGIHASKTDHLNHGDVVYYEYPNDFIADARESLFFARVIGLPGDTIGFDKGKVIRNGTPVDESYALDAVNEILPEIIVPKNYVYILNDNRDLIGSKNLFYGDSRYMGPISLYAIKGVLSSE